MLSSGLDKRGSIAVASGGFTDVWRGDSNGRPVAIKAFRIYPAQNLKEAKEVSRYFVREAFSRTKFTGSLETGPTMAEAIPSKHPIVSWRQYDTLSAFPRL